MSKSIAIRTLLGALVFCVPGVAATTISDTEVELCLRGIEQTAPNTYELAAGTVALLQVRAGVGDTVLVYAAPMEDLSRFFVLVEPQPVNAAGNYLQFFTIPPALAGMKFKLQAIASDPMSKRHPSNELTIAVLDAQILPAPPPAPARIHQARPVLVN